VEMEDRSVHGGLRADLRPARQRQARLAVYRLHVRRLVGGKLVPFAKAYTGLTDEEIRQVDSWVRRNTLERFGPVRAVKPELVFELAFEAIQLSSRHKSGVAVRFPRIARWRHDKTPDEADTLEGVKEILKSQ
jgi:ATP-dependent DNA ligase